ncbi:MAG: rhomboid family intramembrane serine protease [Pseudomonadales bacterium]|nr:rhomboid family intramembrane serine protease [Pseudomonadales bacterium]
MIVLSLKKPHIQKGAQRQKAPVAVVLLILINCLVYFGYQGGDEEKYQLATNFYLNSGLFKMEYPRYSSYLYRVEQSKQAQQAEQAYGAEEFEFLTQLMASDLGFAEHLQEKGTTFWSDKEYSRWQELKEKANTIARSISELRFGLVPAHNTPLTFISHQLLHSNLIHLIGALLLLIILGIPVEQALGVGRTLVSYILCGIGGGIVYSLATFFSDGPHYQPYVGASASIAGLMGMYVAVHGLQKIRFVYFIITFGRSTVPALCLLPLWLGYEAFQTFYAQVPATAFWAHGGGLATGAAIVLATKKWFPVIKEIPIETEDLNLEYKRELAKVMDSIGEMEFSSAASALRKLIDRHPRDFYLLEQLYKLEKLNTKKQSYQKTVEKIFCFPCNDDTQLLAIRNIYRDFKKVSERLSLPLLENQTSCALILKLCRLNLAEEAEKETLMLLENTRHKLDETHSHSRKAVNALATCYDKQNNSSKADHFRELGAREG